MTLPIYFDYAATTPLDPQVLEAMVIASKTAMATLPHAHMPLVGKQKNWLKPPVNTWRI